MLKILCIYIFIHNSVQPRTEPVAMNINNIMNQVPQPIRMDPFIVQHACRLDVT